MQAGPGSSTHILGICFSVWSLLYQIQGRENVVPTAPPEWASVLWPATGHFLSCLGHGCTNSNQPRAHKDTHRPQSLWRALSSSSEQMFIPQRFPSSWDLSSALKKKGRKRNLKLFTLIIPLCCSCLFWFALSSSHTLRSLHVRKLPRCSLEQTLPQVC